MPGTPAPSAAVCNLPAHPPSPPCREAECAVLEKRVVMPDPSSASLVRKLLAESAGAAAAAAAAAGARGRSRAAKEPREWQHGAAQSGLEMVWRQRHRQLASAVLEQGYTLMPVPTHPACPSPSPPEQPSPATVCASTSPHTWRSLMRRLRARGRGGAVGSAASGAARRGRPKVRTQFTGCMTRG